MAFPRPKGDLGTDSVVINVRFYLGVILDYALALKMLQNSQQEHRGGERKAAEHSSIRAFVSVVNFGQENYSYMHFPISYLEHKDAE